MNRRPRRCSRMIPDRSMLLLNRRNSCSKPSLSRISTRIFAHHHLFAHVSSNYPSRTHVSHCLQIWPHQYTLSSRNDACPFAMPSARRRFALGTTARNRRAYRWRRDGPALCNDSTSSFAGMHNPDAHPAMPAPHSCLPSLELRETNVQRMCRAAPTMDINPTSEFCFRRIR